MTVASPAEDTATRVLRGAAAGLVAGVFAAFAMDRFQALVAKASPSDGDAEPATAKAADKVKRAATAKPVPKAQQPLAGQFVHYSLGAALGMAYGIAAEFRPQVAAGYGSAYALGVTGLLDEAAVPAVGLGPAPWKTGPATHVYSITSHLVFGAVAEFTRRQVRSTLLPR